MERHFRTRPPNALNAYNIPLKDENDRQLSFGTPKTSSGSGIVQGLPFIYAQKPQIHLRPKVPGIPNNLRLSQPRSSLVISSHVSTFDPQQQRIRQVAPTKRKNAIPFNLGTSTSPKYEDHDIPGFHLHTSNLSDEFSPNDCSSPVRSPDHSKLSNQSLGDHTLVFDGLKTPEGAKIAINRGQDSRCMPPIIRPCIFTEDVCQRITPQMCY
jgi:hypothetical protein